VVRPEYSDAVLSDAVGLMDEAFAILLHENCYERWLVCAEVASGKT